MWLINFLKWFFGLGNNVAEPVQQRKSSCNDEDDFFSKQRQIVVENFNSVPHEYYENINYMRFQGTAKYIATGRNRKIDKESFSEDELREQLIEDGYDKDSIVISRVEIEKATEPQMNVMIENNYPTPIKASKIDTSYIMSRIFDHETPADPELFRLATEKKIKISYFSGKDSLYFRFWHEFSERQKFAFYLLCVDHDITSSWHLEKFDFFESLYEQYANYPEFMNSFKKIINSDFEGFDDTRAGKNTNAYKIAFGIVTQYANK